MKKKAEAVTLPPDAIKKNGYSISEYEKSKIAAIAEEQAKGIIYPLRQRPPKNNRMLLSLFSKI